MCYSLYTVYIDSGFTTMAFLIGFGYAGGQFKLMKSQKSTRAFEGADVQADSPDDRKLQNMRMSDVVLDIRDSEFEMEMTSPSAKRGASRQRDEDDEDDEEDVAATQSASAASGSELTVYSEAVSSPMTDSLV